MNLSFIEDIKVKGEKDDTFVGIKTNGHKISFYRPQTYHFDKNNENASAQIIKFLESLRLSNTFANEDSHLFQKNEASSFPLSSSLWIIKDFLQNGFFINREKELKSNTKGKVNWKKTFQTTPIVSDGNIIYKNIINEVIVPVDNLLVQIHKICVKKSLDLLGWIFGLPSSIVECPSFNEDLKYFYSQTIKKELSKTFDDVKRIRLRHMENIILGLNPHESTDNNFSFGINNYHYVFERMVDSVFGTENNMKDFYPNCEWHLCLPNRNENFPSTNLRPDTIMVRDDIYVLDSKFYQFGYTASRSDLPTSTSIQKQITYGEYILKNNKRKIKNVFNAFILPYDKLDNKFGLSNDLEYVGTASASWKKDGKDYSVVHTFLIDLNHLVEIWNKTQTTDIDKLINEIQNHKLLGQTA